ncbi:cytochrome b [Hyphomonas sp. WL0036]|uniref:cytochrome b n=1 Tax=Hyphomonas sediminis TaxID=2866160 RepID=UPI001C7EBEC4|nr:cytochrome b [Hyphomonas sediminis]MBY9068368.1 cytochrome b [Hyphomonas sediminis]
MSDKTNGTFGGISRLNHWLGALLYLGMLAVGFTLAFDLLTREQAGPLRDLHKATGTVLLVFAFWRIVWRFREGFPAPVAGVPAWQAAASRAVHWGLILCILAMPLSGVLMSLFGGRAIDIYGLFSIPGFSKVESIQQFARSLHGLVPYAFVALILAHTLGALKHALLDKDATLARMISSKQAA